MDEVIDNIISMQSNYDDLQRYADPVQMPNTVSSCRTAKFGEVLIQVQVCLKGASIILVADTNLQEK